MAERNEFLMLQCLGPFEDMQTLQREGGREEKGKKKKRKVACFLHSMFSFTEREAQPMGKSIAQISIANATSMSVYPLLKHCPSGHAGHRARYGVAHTHTHTHF